MKETVIVLGIDGADFEVIQYLVSRGDLKHFQKLMSDGVFGPLKSTIPPFTAPAWTSFFTGVHPEKHGIHDFVSRNPDTYDLALVSSRDRRVAPLWSIISERNKRVAVVNIPMTYPPEALNGIMISGFPFSSQRDRDITFPLTLLRELEGEYGSYELREANIIGIEYEEKKTKWNISTYVEAMKKVFDISLHLMYKEPFDCFITEIQELDPVQHEFWCFWDDIVDFHVHKENLGRAVPRIYAEIDLLLGKMMDSMNEKCTLFVISDHGFGRVGLKTPLNNWLLQNGFLRSRQSNYLSKISPILGRKAFAILMKKVGLGKLARYAPESLLYLFSKWLSMRERSIDSADIEWSQTKAYSLGYPQYIYINLKGREPQGIVDENHYSTVVGEIQEGLRKINTIDKIYTAPPHSSLPDICFTMKEVSVFSTASDIPLHPDHRQEGIFMAYGDNVKEGWKVNASMVDIAPTILHILEVPIPTYMDGRVLKEVFKEGSEPALREVDYTKRSEEQRVRDVVGKLKEERRI
ncbi:MAG: alkaline phosphatase family protein [Candidatus Methanofastidiosia archaeon]